MLNMALHCVYRSIETGCWSKVWQEPVLFQYKNYSARFVLVLSFIKHETYDHHSCYKVLTEQGQIGYLFQGDLKNWKQCYR